jgi:hypothetical protein
MPDEDREAAFQEVERLVRVTVNVERRHVSPRTAELHECVGAPRSAAVDMDLSNVVEEAQPILEAFCGRHVRLLR